MPTLTALPNEVLHQIILYLEHDLSALRKLSILNHNLYALTRPHLYRRINVFITTRKDPLSVGYDLFMRTLTHEPLPGPLVRHVVLMLQKGLVEIHTRANTLLRLLPGLVTLRIDAGHGRVGFTPTFLASNPLYALTELVLNDPQLTIPVLISWLALPSLHSVTTSVLYFPPNAPRMPASPSTPSALSSLKLGSTHIRPPLLHALLSHTPQLSALSLALPGLSTPFAPRVTHNMMVALSPAEVAAALEPVQGSLRVLNLSSGVMTGWGGHDGTRMDFSAWSQLRELNVPASCLFATMGPARTGRDGIGRLLPRSLEVLQISFDFEWGVLYLDDGWAAFDAAGHGEVERWKWAWLEEIARGKNERWPGLRAVKLEERIKQPKGFYYDRVVWMQPRELVELYKEVDVTLEVWLRQPLDVDL
ncbi:hypothetical protein MMC11_004652 [Xylographa trunciseda]|nr:hypothetical protein [Xylographa trunciseda]